MAEVSELLEIPERAISCFESWSRTVVTLYDFCGEIGMHLKHDRYHHNFGICESIKARLPSNACTQFDYGELMQRCRHFRGGAVKICPAGLLEWVMPIYFGDILAGVLTAGIRRPPCELPPEIPCLNAATSLELRQPLPNEIPMADAVEIELVREGLNQLVTRLRDWHENFRPGHFERSDLPRGIRAEAIIRRRCREHFTLKMLAAELHLSESRASHAIREETGRTFKELMTEHRINFAISLLKYSSLSIEEISRKSGFIDLSHFYRSFRHVTGRTPLECRRGRLPQAQT